MYWLKTRKFEYQTVEGNFDMVHAEARFRSDNSAFVQHIKFDSSCEDARELAKNSLQVIFGDLLDEPAENKMTEKDFDSYVDMQREMRRGLECHD
jgi:hypothetical protein